MKKDWQYQVLVRHGATGTFIYCYGSIRWYNHIRKELSNFFKKINMHLPYDLTMTLLGIYPIAMKTYVCKMTCTQIFKAALAPQKWKETKYTLRGKRICKLGYIQTMELYTAIKKSILLLHKETWMYLKTIMLSGKN